MKIRSYSIYLSLLTFIFLFSACSSIYMPNVPATPMFKNQGEGYIATHVNTKGNISANAGVAITEHVAVLANGSSVKKGKNTNHQFEQWLAEGAIGYYTTMGKNQRQVLEVYAGYGVGNTRDIDQRASIHGYQPVESRIMDFDKMFVQVNYSSTKKNKIKLFGEKRTLNYGTAIRVSRIGMKDFSINAVKQDNEENLFIEPIFFTRMQLVKGLQLQYTAGFNMAVVKNEYLKAGNSVLTLGITYNFGSK